MSSKQVSWYLWSTRASTIRLGSAASDVAAAVAVAVAASGAAVAASGAAAVASGAAAAASGAAVVVVAAADITVLTIADITNSQVRLSEDPCAGQTPAAQGFFL